MAAIRDLERKRYQAEGKQVTAPTSGVGAPVRHYTHGRWRADRHRDCFAAQRGTARLDPQGHAIPDRQRR